MMSGMDLDAALTDARPLAEAEGCRIIGYWQDPDAIIFALEPPPMSDALLVAEVDGVDWIPYGPINEADQWDDLLETDPTPLDEPAPAPADEPPTVPADDSTAGPADAAAIDDVTRLRLLVDALSGDEDAPADVLKRARDDLAAAEGTKA